MLATQKKKFNPIQDIELFWLQIPTEGLFLYNLSGN